jgi:hypothetical protein
MESDSPDETRVYLQLDFNGARPEIKCAMMTSRERISARSWRQVPFDDIEVQALMTIGGLKDVLQRPAEVEASPEVLERYFQATEAEFGYLRNFTPSGYVVGPFRGPDGEPAEKPFTHIRRLKPPERPIPDEFYEDLAEVYKGYVGNKVAPAPAIAKQTRVSVRTVHGWISEARKRGHLPPARRGAAG